MNENKLDANEIYYNEGIERFMNNQDIYDDFLLRFKDEEVLNQIKKYHDDGSVKEMFLSIHALKGLAGNLSLHHLHSICSNMLICYRNNLIDNIDDMYYDLMKTIKYVNEMIESAMN